MLYVCIHGSVVVCCFFLGPDQWPLPVVRLSCNYTTVCDVWVFKRSNTVSILSQGKDLRRVSRRYKRSPAVFWCHTIVFFWGFFAHVSFFFSVLCLTFMCGEWASKMSLALRSDYWAEDSRWNRLRRWDKQTRRKGKEGLKELLKETLQRLICQKLQEETQKAIIGHQFLCISHPNLG